MISLMVYTGGKIIIGLCDPFSRASPLGRRVTKEGHIDPSKRAFRMYYDYEMHI
jgi:hypothetical protein